jgi:uncharacterized membrane protein YgcG
MNWIRENKFLTGFIAVMVIGVGALGYLLYSAWGNYDDVTDTFNSQASALKQLQTRIPYPDETNLSKYKAQENDFVDATHDLAANLAQMVLPVQDLSPSAFQDRLRETVSVVIADAGKAGVKLPDHFYMDFDKYQTSPPTPEAASALGRQLAALKAAVEIAINEHVDSISKLTRTPVPQEGGAEAGAGGGGGGGNRFGGGGNRFGGGGPRGGGGGASGGLVEKYPFDLQFTASQPVFQKVLNDFAASTNQFFITRTLLVENTNPKPIARDSSTPAPATTGTDANGAVTSGTDSTTGRLTFLVGTEKLDVAMRVDIVAFNPPAKAARSGVPR